MNMFGAVSVARKHKGLVWYSREKVFAVTYTDDDGKFIAIVDGDSLKVSSMEEFRKRYPLMEVFRDFSGKRMTHARKRQLGWIE